MKSFMKYVCRKTSGDSHGSMYLLECGHEVYRYGRRRPTRLLCTRCEWKATKQQEAAGGAREKQ